MFLKYLEAQGATELQLVNHMALERKAADPNMESARVSYVVKAETETCWRPNKPKDADYTYWSLKLDPAKLRAANHLSVIIKLECLLRAFI